MDREDKKETGVNLEQIVDKYMEEVKLKSKRNNPDDLQDGNASEDIYDDP